jgi:hypothetical protein
MIPNNERVTSTLRAWRANHTALANSEVNVFAEFELFLDASHGLAEK